jgi:hypothetical protein
VALGGEDVEAAQLDHPLVLRVGDPARFPERAGPLLLGDGGGVHAALPQHLPRQEVGISPQEDVGAAAGHVGRDRDRADPPRLGDDLGFLLVILGVQHLVVGHAAPLEELGQALRLLDGHRPDQDGAPLLVQLLDFPDDGVELLALGLVDDVGVRHPDERAVGRDHRDVQLVDLRELGGFGVRGAGHAGELRVHAEVVLERDRRERLVLVLDLRAFLRLDGLVQAV